MTNTRVREISGSAVRLKIFSLQSCFEHDDDIIRRRSLHRIARTSFPGPEPFMPCFCSAQLSSLFGSLSAIPSVAGLVPPMPMNLVAALSAAASGGIPAPAPMSATGTLTANLALMASLSASASATTGMSLNASLLGASHAGLQASLQASLSETIASLNANAGSLNLHQGLLQRLLSELAALCSLAGVVGAVRATCGIDLRAAGAVDALHARLAAMARLSAAARPSMAVNAVGRVSAAESLMTSLGFPISAHGAAALGASMQALSRLTLALPRVSVDLGLLSALSALMAIIAAIRNALGVNLLAANAMASLRLALTAMPLAALAGLQLQASASAAAAMSATASASASASALAGLDLSAAAGANLSAASTLALVLGLAAQHSALLAPAGSCGSPCSVALLKAV